MKKINLTKTVLALIAVVAFIALMLFGDFDQLNGSHVLLITLLSITALPVAVLIHMRAKKYVHLHRPQVTAPLALLLLWLTWMVATNFMLPLLGPDVLLLTPKFVKKSQVEQYRSALDDPDKILSLHKECVEKVKKSDSNEMPPICDEFTSTQLYTAQYKVRNEISGCHVMGALSLTTLSVLISFFLLLITCKSSKE